MTRRIYVKIPDKASKDEMQRIISEAFGYHIPISDDYYNRYFEASNEKLRIRELIDPFYTQLTEQNDKNSKEKINELIDLGKFIYRVHEVSENRIDIIECDSEMIPDFVVRFQDKRVGIEHTRLIDNNVVQEISGLKTVLEETQDILHQRNASYKGLFNVFFSNNEPLCFHGNYRSFSTKEKKVFNERHDNLPIHTADYIEALINGQQIESPFIDRVIYADSLGLEIELSEDYILKDLTKEKVLHCITAKEAKIDSYKKAKELSHCWLFVVVDGVSAKSSFELKMVELPEDHKSQFDQIIIFNNFTKEFRYSKPVVLP